MIKTPSAEIFALSDDKREHTGSAFYSQSGMIAAGAIKAVHFRQLPTAK
jgi:hypothetical protein